MTKRFVNWRRKSIETESWTLLISLLFLHSLCLFFSIFRDCTRSRTISTLVQGKRSLREERGSIIKHDIRVSRGLTWSRSCTCLDGSSFDRFESFLKVVQISRVVARLVEEERSRSEQFGDKFTLFNYRNCSFKRPFRVLDRVNILEDVIFESAIFFSRTILRLTNNNKIRYFFFSSTQIMKRSRFPMKKESSTISLYQFFSIFSLFTKL